MSGVRPFTLATTGPRSFDPGERRLTLVRVHGDHAVLAEDPPPRVRHLLLLTLGDTRPIRPPAEAPSAALPAASTLSRARTLLCILLPLCVRSRSQENCG